MDIVDEVIKLKKETGAIILAHNYQSPEVQDVADFVGDSLELSMKALESRARVIVFAGVDFMAEQAAILNEDSIVLHPDPEARCPMAQMITVEELRKFKKLYPEAPAIVYVNSPAIVKAEADYVATSANVVELVRLLSSDVVIFGPDAHLAQYIAERTGKVVIPVPRDGYCPIHIKFNANNIQKLIKIYGKACFIAHPECPKSVRDLAQFVGSTSQMVKYVKTSGERVFIVGTEIGIIYRMVKENPDKIFVPASTEAICEDMKKITLDKVLKSLRERVYRVLVDRAIAIRVRRAIENTFNVLGVDTPWKE
ncbi:MAG: quinolinate synthase NadA [Nitrososphaerota archaeon]